MKRKITFVVEGSRHGVSHSWTADLKHHETVESYRFYAPNTPQNVTWRQYFSTAIKIEVSRGDFSELPGRIKAELTLLT